MFSHNFSLEQENKRFFLMGCQHRIWKYPLKKIIFFSFFFSFLINIEFEDQPKIRTTFCTVCNWLLILCLETLLAPMFIYTLYIILIKMIIWKRISPRRAVYVFSNLVLRSSKLILPAQQVACNELGFGEIYIQTLYS